LEEPAISVFHLQTTVLMTRAVAACIQLMMLPEATSYLLSRLSLFGQDWLQLYACCGHLLVGAMVENNSISGLPRFAWISLTQRCGCQWRQLQIARSAVQHHGPFEALRFAARWPAAARWEILFCSFPTVSTVGYLVPAPPVLLPAHKPACYQCAFTKRSACMWTLWTDWTHWTL
jgi:hypothetical protein